MFTPAVIFLMIANTMAASGAIFAPMMTNLSLAIYSAATFDRSQDPDAVKHAEFLAIRARLIPVGAQIPLCCPRAAGSSAVYAFHDCRRGY